MKITVALMVIVSVLAVGCVSHRSTPTTDQSNDATQNSSPTNSLKPKLGYVPDEATAIAIAKAVWLPVFGKEGVEAQRPIRGKLQNGVWVVEGGNPGPVTVNGFPMFVALISQDDGRILEVNAFYD
jgi:hypothetical protein